VNEQHREINVSLLIAIPGHRQVKPAWVSPFRTPD
jgi:hypothetical protein